MVQLLLCTYIVQHASIPAVPKICYSTQDVHFGYGNQREVVGGVDLTVEPGQSVALVGPSGSGKSTILKLLMRLYDVNSGSILLDGIDTRELKQVGC